MLEGVEISEIRFSKARSNYGESRWDSEYYDKNIVSTISKLERLNCEKLGGLSKSIKKGIFDLSPDNYRKKGIPFIRTSEIKDPLINFGTTVYLDEKTNNENKKTILKSNDLVFTKIGSYIGDVAILPSTFEEYNFSQNVAGVSLKNKSYGPILLAFFMSKYGKLQILRSAMLSGQGKLELSDIRNYLIPKFLFKNQVKVETDILQSFENLKQAQIAYSTAETILLERLGLQKFKVSEQAVNVKSFSASFGLSGRLDAEFYQVKYESYKKQIESNEFVKIQDEYNQVKTKSNFNLASYKYIEIGDINVSDGSYSFNEIITEELPANAKIMVKKGDILISTVRPNRGAVAIIADDRDDLIVSGAFTVLRKKAKSKFNSEFLKVLLRTEIYKDWLLQFNVGTSYPVIKDEDILNLSIPKVNEETLAKITQLIQQSNQFCIKSKALLEQAKLSVELAIEKDEKSTSNL